MDELLSSPRAKAPKAKMALGSCSHLDKIIFMGFLATWSFLFPVKKTVQKLGSWVCTLLSMAVFTRKPRTLRTTLFTPTGLQLWPVGFSVPWCRSTPGLSCPWAGEASGGWGSAWSGWTRDWSSSSISLWLPVSSSSSSSMHDWSVWITYSKSSKWNRCQEPRFTE